MKKEHIDIVSREVYRRFPDFKGVSPQVQVQPPVAGRVMYQLTFKHNAALSDGHKIARWVRVSADDQAHILKITTSR